MKEIYWETGSKAELAGEMLTELFPSGQKRAKSLNTERAALLALDLQQYFLEPDSHAFVPSAPAILPAINTLAERFAAKGRPVVYSQHINDGANAGGMSDWWRDLIGPDHPFKSLSPALDVSLGEILIKPQYDAFYQTDLEARLQGHGVQQVVIGGLMTHLCCETTARAAFVRGFDVFFLVDGTASYNREFHMASLRNLGHGFATLVTVQQVAEALAG